ncbi:MAG: amidohydrolase family protein [Xanthobacteraceae bacterium]
MLDVSPSCPPPDPQPRKPRFALPSSSCDSHFHVFGPHAVFPFAANRPFTPHDAPKEALLRLHEVLGFERGVFVQSTCHGSDHAVMLDLLAATSGRYRGVALLTPATTPEEVKRLDAAGVCGVRLHFVSHLGPYPARDDVRAVMRLVEPYGWHIEVHVYGKDLLANLDFIAAIKARVVIDHIGRVDVREGPDGPAFVALRRLVDAGNVWVKLSGTDRVSQQEPPFRDAVALARILAEQAPERNLWGTDWPHPNVRRMPNDGELVDLIPDIAVNDTTRRRMLVDNPAEFFGFD